MNNSSHYKFDLSFSERLNQLMIERGLYPAEISRGTGISRSLIYRYSNGLVQPTAYNIKVIAKYFKVSSDWLLGIK